MPSFPDTPMISTLDWTYLVSSRSLIYLEASYPSITGISQSMKIVFTEVIE
jgi:hypothetical protein